MFKFQRPGTCYSRVADYCSGDLQIEGIIGPDIPLEERKPEDLTPDEARELIRRMRAHAPVAQTKQERGSQREKSVKREYAIIIIDDDDSDKEGTSAARSSPQKRAKVEVESVDLTDI